MTTENALYIDLLVTGEDITLDTGKQPILCDKRTSISQDIKHALLESGLVTALIGERSRVLRSDILLQMELLIEEDERIVAGSIILQDTQHQDELTLNISAETVDFGPIHFGVRLQ